MHGSLHEGCPIHISSSETWYVSKLRAEAWKLAEDFEIPTPLAFEQARCYFQPACSRFQPLKVLISPTSCLTCTGSSTDQEK